MGLEDYIGGPERIQGSRQLLRSNLNIVLKRTSGLKSNTGPTDAQTARHRNLHEGELEVPAAGADFGLETTDEDRVAQSNALA